MKSWQATSLEQEVQPTPPTTLSPKNLTWTRKLFIISLLPNMLIVEATRESSLIDLTDNEREID